MTTEKLQNHLKHVESRIREAAIRSGRAPDAIQLVAVTKTQSVETLEKAYAAGVRTVGENRVQELLAKWPSFEDRFEWHIIGHLQSNKVKYIIDKVALIHSVDSLKLAQEISRQAIKIGKVMPVLIQVNPAEEETKFGLSSSEVELLVREAALLPGIKIQGLMTIAPFVEDEGLLRQVFSEMRQIFDHLKEVSIQGVEMKYLSMGMTHDFEIAIEEGATMVRIGSGLFGERQ
ncbi:MAG: YggS family pyridoxal phosphate-dependent enzyme [Acidaminobacter sp.]|nr:YggS family pyridoxal phosphate-dependent enzyme [Acidaminobacter sp.]MDK9709643.1 YggS family pyridoxal phosphate-dependent enzyme [Acidaminobacter sp.]MZQ97836.1 YggS family pyridoxal phosphate-dependent enzyme [Acidaminobacter sp.]